MQKKPVKKLNPLFKSEYKNFIEDYLFNLLGLVNDEQTPRVLISEERNVGDKAVIELKNDCLYFIASGWSVFKLELQPGEKIDTESLHLARRVIESFFQVSKYNRTGTGKQIDSKYFSGNPDEPSLFKQTLYRFAVQKGVCGWLIAHTDNTKIERFLDILETWAVKTYEGKSVSLGFIFEPDAKSRFDDNQTDWLDFMESDNVAVLTDCIHSAVVLNKNCNFVKYVSISNGNSFDNCDTACYVPLRFTHMIRQYVVGPKTVGIFLLTNGDILLAKNQRVCFVKRNNRWLNLSHKAFTNALEKFSNKYSIGNELIDNIYASILDISFSHTGGIISVIGSPSPDNIKRLEGKVLSDCDNLLNGMTDKDLRQQLKRKTAKDSIPVQEEKKHELERKLLKRRIIKALIERHRFQDMDRKIRGELIGLDGACILKCDGSIYSFGAIIQNDTGSTDGGRAAAAKKLSEFGMAVKISTDGYIEVYIDRVKVYEIK